MPNQAITPPPYPPQGYLPQQPPNKKHTFRNIILIILGLFMLGFVGCAVLIGSAVNEVDKSIKSSEKKDAAPGGPDNPMVITEGKAFEVSGFNYQAGWKVRTDVLGSAEIVGLKVENNRNEKDSALVEIKFMNGSEVLALIDCTTEPIAVGQTTTLNCIGMDDLPKKYSAITINDSF
jgi:hypothetical protein